MSCPLQVPGCRLHVCPGPGPALPLQNGASTQSRSLVCPIIFEPARRGVTGTHLFSVVPHLSRLLLAVLLVPPGLPLRSVHVLFLPVSGIRISDLQQTDWMD